MASLHLCPHSTPYLSAEHNQTCLKPLQASFLKHSNQFNTSNTCLSFSLSLPHSPLLPIRPNKFNPLVSHFSSTTQVPVTESAESAGKGKQEEEFSRNRLVAQNIPWTCTTEDIRGLFEKFGTVLDVELSMHNQTRNRGLAFVTMSSPEEADNALKNLESFEFQGRSLKMNYAYLKRKKVSPPQQQLKSSPTFNLFVSNLPFDAKAKDIKEFFDSHGTDTVSAEIVYNVNPRRPSGYGFVAFKTKKEADNALSTFQGKEFKGRPLRIARSKQFVREARKEVDECSTELDSELEQKDDSSTELDTKL